MKKIYFTIQSVVHTKQCMIESTGKKCSFCMNVALRIPANSSQVGRPSVRISVCPRCVFATRLKRRASAPRPTVRADAEYAETEICHL